MRNLVHLPEYGKNAPYIVDFIEICLKVKLLDLAKIRDMYVVNGLSASQIASHFRVSRASIFTRLHSLGIRNGDGGRAANPDNYRQSVAPYGYCVKDGKLLPSKSEVRICRLVVDLIERQNKTHSEVARELSRLGYKNRAGKKEWNSKTIFNIYNRWKNKI